MPVTLVKTANFGPGLSNITGSSGVGYVVYDKVGNVVLPRTTVGVYQLVTGSGVYAAPVTFNDGFNGQVVWDVPLGGVTASYAVEQYNVQENDPKVADTWNMVNSITGSIQSLYNIQYGRWKIVGNTMVFYGPDNSTLLATFNLFDVSGNPTNTNVFERQKV